MSFFSTVLLKLSPLYLNILLGFVAAKLLDTPRDAIARFMFYIVSPLIMFNGVLQTRIDWSVLSLPILTFCIGSGLCLLFYWIGQKVWEDSSANLLAFSAGSGNTGYFGLPIAFYIFDAQGVGVYMMALLGVTIYENSIGFYICAKGTHSPSECIQKLIRLPILYAFALALAINYLNIPIPLVFHEFICHIKGTYAVLGMMVIGLGLAGLTHFKLDFAFIGLTFLAKFVMWPVLILALLFLDTHWFHIFSPDIHHALVLLSIVPLATNMVILAFVLKSQPEKSATAVLLSTLFALIFIPFMLIYFVMKSTDFFAEFPCPIPIIVSH